MGELKCTRNILGIMSVLAVASICLGYMLKINIEYNPNLDLKFSDIFLNNLMVNFRTVILATLTIGIYGPVFVVQEMFSLGVVIRGVAIKQNLGYALSFIGFHAFFEIPAIILAGAIGVNIWTQIFRSIRKKEVFKKAIYQNVIFCVVLLILTFIAAFVEANVTTHFLKNIVMGGK